MDDLLHLPWWIDPSDPSSVRASTGMLVARIDPEGGIGDAASALARELLLQANPQPVRAEAALITLRGVPSAWTLPPDGRHPHSFEGWKDLDDLGLVVCRRVGSGAAARYLWRRSGEGERFIAAFDALSEANRGRS